MAQVEVKDNGGKKKKGQQKKMNIHVDFTPMVDMNMLLITFFMLCTTMTESRTMDLVMPSKDAVPEEQQSKLKESEAITVLIGHNDQVFYFLGQPNEENQGYKNYNFLVESSLDPEAEGSIRQLLQDKNKEVIELVGEADLAFEEESAAINKRGLDEEKRLAALEVAEALRDSLISDAKSMKGAPMVVIKAMTKIEEVEKDGAMASENPYVGAGDGATYEALVDVLDEMIINNVGRYAVVDMTEADYYLIGNYLTQGGLAESSDFGK